MFNSIKRKFYNLLREAEIERDNRILKVVYAIQEFYLSKYDNEENTYVKAREDIGKLEVTELDYKGDTFTITLQRPGLLIGRKGENINSLNEFLRNRVDGKIKISIKETKYVGSLMPYQDYSANYEDLLV